MERGGAANLNSPVTPAERVPAPRAPTPAEAFRYWLRLGFISFGGPAGQIAIMHRELVDERRWVSERRFLHALNYCMVLPGPEAQQLATYLGWLLHRTWGGIVAGALFVLPSLLLLVLLSWLYVVYGNVPLVAAAFNGVKPVVVAIVAHAAWRIGSRALRHPLLWAIAAAAFVALFAFGVPFPAIVLAAAVAGAVGSRVVPAAFSGPRMHDVRAGPHVAAVIDDDTPPPAHARFSKRRLLLVVTGCLIVWGVAYGALVATAGAASELVRMAAFFTKAAFLTFGGAYAVLPYVNQAAVETFGWLSAAQMIDGLALGETTPGPLIMIVAFVGFLGAWTKAALGPDALAIAGAVGACVATFFTFLPSFLFILAGGPLVESTRGEVRYTAPLAGVTAAVVGVIVNLAAFFAVHAIAPRGAIDPVAVVIALGAALALFRFRVGVIRRLAIARFAANRQRRIGGGKAPRNSAVANRAVRGEIPLADCGRIGSAHGCRRGARPNGMQDRGSVARRHWPALTRRFAPSARRRSAALSNATPGRIGTCTVADNGIPNPAVRTRRFAPSARRRSAARVSPLASFANNAIVPNRPSGTFFGRYSPLSVRQPIRHSY